MTIRAIAFDLDGTLCHTLPDLIAAANASRAHMGLPPLPDAVIESYIGDGIPRIRVDDELGRACARDHDVAQP